MMKDWIDIVYSSPQMIKLKLKDQTWLDMGVFHKMEVDQNCITGIWEAESQIITYQIGDFLRLGDVFVQHVFEEQEGYIFLHHLFEDMINANRNKPVIMEPDFVFVSPYGDVYCNLKLINFWTNRNSKLTSFFIMLLYGFYNQKEAKKGDENHYAKV